MEYLNVLSLGAGKQSSYMLIRSLEGAYKYKPDIAIMSDLKCEPQYVYDYIDWLVRYVKDRFDFDIIFVSTGDLIKDTEDYINGKKSRVASLPLRLARDENGKDGMIMRQCTNDYKIAPIKRYLQKIRNGKKIRFWIGISLDEIERVKVSRVKYIENYYPLVESRTRTDAIINWFDENNLRQPGKSACLICPFHSDQYWRRFKKEFPDEFEKACVFDDKIRIYPNLKRKAYLHRSLKPLRNVDFSYEPSLFPELIEDCEGLCGL